MTGRALPDAEARKRAVTDFTSNLVILAGAGTGKTSLLIERVLNAVGSDEFELDKIGAITFTEKAAGEMRLRMARGLDRLYRLAGGHGSPDPTDEAGRSYRWLVEERGCAPGEIAERALRAIESLDRSRVSTIHTFCAELLRDHPVAAGVDPDFTVDTGEHRTALQEQAWERFLIGELGPQASKPDEWAALLESFSIAEVREIAFGLAASTTPDELIREQPRSPEARELFGEEARAAVAALESLIGRCRGTAPIAAALLPEVQRALEELLDHGHDAFRSYVDARTIKDKPLAERIHGKWSSGKKISITADEWEEVTAPVRALCRALLRIRSGIAEAVIPLVLPFVREFRERYLQQGFVDFDGMLTLARNLLRDHPGVRKTIKQRYQALLVDEFQDTDPVQHEIVLFLAEEIEGRAAEAYEGALAPGRLFVVGDPKQSIYRFRGADYDAYRRSVGRILDGGGARLELVANFRSVPGILEPVNRIFEQSAEWGNEERYQPPYEAIHSMREPAGDDCATELWSIGGEGTALAAIRREEEGLLLADEIRRLHDEDQVPYGSISMLFRTFSTITHYLRPLRRAGIPFVVDGGKEFLKRPEVGQLMATLRTLAQPADAPALLAFLRSPAGAVSDRELAAWAGAKHRWDRDVTVDAGAFPRIAASFRLLRELAEETRNLPADAVVRKVVERSLLLPLGAAAFEGAQRVANLEKLASAAGDLARDGRLSLEEVVDALREGRLAEIHTDRPLSDDAADAVRITSIHRMKGLENDHVFLPDLARPEWSPNAGGPAVRVVQLPDGRRVLGLAAGSERDAAAVWLDRENERHDVAEEARVFYVATTRAREKLVLLASHSRKRSRWLAALEPWGFAVDDRPADGARLAGNTVLHRSLEPRGEVTPAAPADPRQVDAAVATYRRVLEQMQAAVGPRLQAPSGLRDDDPPAPGEPGRPGRAASRETAKAAGIVMHRLLERPPDTAERGDWDARLDELVEAVAAAEEVPVDRLRKECHELLTGFASSELWGRFAAVEVLGREAPLLWRDDDGKHWRGTIDLLYRDAEGQVVVADYKTDRGSDDAALVARYRDQLTRYAEGVRHAWRLPKRPRMELWSLRDGRIHELA